MIAPEPDGTGHSCCRWRRDDATTDWSLVAAAARYTHSLALGLPASAHFVSDGLACV